MIKQVIKATKQSPIAEIIYTADRPFRILQLTDMQIIDLDCTRNPTRDRQIKGAYFKEGVPDMDIRCFQYSYLTDLNGLSQLIINGIATVLDGYGAVAATTGNHSNGLAAVTTQGKQECIQLAILCLDGADNVLLTFQCFSQIHILHLLYIPVSKLAQANLNVKITD